MKIGQARSMWVSDENVMEAIFSDEPICFSLEIGIGTGAHQETRCFIPDREKSRPFMESLRSFSGVIFREIPHGYTPKTGWLLESIQPCTPEEFANALENIFQRSV